MLIEMLQKELEVKNKQIERLTAIVEKQVRPTFYNKKYSVNQQCKEKPPSAVIKRLMRISGGRS